MDIIVFGRLRFVKRFRHDAHAEGRHWLLESYFESYFGAYDSLSPLRIIRVRGIGYQLERGECHFTEMPLWPPRLWRGQRNSIFIFYKAQTSIFEA